MKKSLLFITTKMSIGGIETYIVRMSNHLIDELNITILILSDQYSEELLNKLHNDVKIVILNEYLVIPFLKKINKSSLNAISPIKVDNLMNDIGHIDFIHSVDSFCNYFAIRLVEYDHRIRLTTGVYHSQEYIWNTNFNTYFRNIHKKLIRHLPKENIFFCNEASVSAIERHYKCPFQSSPIIPIGIDIGHYQSINPDYYSKRIISIGRLVDFKKYNKHIIKIIDDLNADGNIYEYHIYGDGYERFHLETMAEIYSSRIIFHGQIKYYEMPLILNNSFAFIGVGTSIIESAACGIPSLVGIESEEKPLTYGFFSSIKGFSYQEDSLSLKRVPILDLLMYLKKLSKIDYNKLSKKERIKSQEFSIDKTKNLFLQNLLKSKKIKREFHFNRNRYLYSYIFWLIMKKLKMKIFHNYKTVYD